MADEGVARAPGKRVSKRIKSVEIGYRVLLAVQQGPGSVKLSEIAKRCALSSGAAHNYLVSLVNTGLVEQEERGRYRLGPSAFALSLASFRHLDGYDIAREAAQTLHISTGESTAVAVWSQGGPVSVFAQRAGNAAGMEFRTGRLSLLGTAAGQIFMTFLPEPQMRELLEDELEGAADRDGRIESILRSAREHVLPDGYARYSYANPAPFALAAPIWTEDGRLPFVLSIVAHEPASPETVDRWLKELLRVARQASLLMSQMGSTAPASEICPRPLDRYN